MVPILVIVKNVYDPDTMLRNVTWKIHGNDPLYSWREAFICRTDPSTQRPLYARSGLRMSMSWQDKKFRLRA